MAVVEGKTTCTLCRSLITPSLIIFRNDSPARMVLCRPCCSDIAQLLQRVIGQEVIR